MADVRPFHGTYYNVTDPALAICPPYDIISPTERDRLYEQSPNNFVRVEFTRPDPADGPMTKYDRAAATLGDWLKKGVLKTDQSPAFYLYDQEFRHKEGTLSRRSIISIIGLEDWHKMIVRPHEDTFSGPKVDRLNLIRRLQANTSPVLGLYEDKRKAVSRVLSVNEKKKPLLDIQTPQERHVVRAIDAPGDTDAIHAAFAGKAIYIADGHHRYESALNYSKERHAAEPGPAGQPYDYVLMFLVEMDDPGMVIFPTHRLIRGLPEKVINDLKAGLPEYFDLENLPLSSAGAWQRLDSILDGKKDIPDIVLSGLEPGQLTVLKLRDLAKAERTMPEGHSPAYRKLDVSILDHVVLAGIMGLDPKDERISFTHDIREAVGAVKSGEQQLAFLLNRVKPSSITSIADACDRMPRKSTYFYPKLPSGLMMYRMKP